LLRYRGGECLIVGAAGTGKSRAALEKIHLVCLLTPKVRALVIRKTAVSLTASAIKTYESDVAVQALLDGTVTFFGGNRREPAQYRYSNGSSIALGGMDNPMKVMSTEYDIIFVQEATELEVDEWEALTTRLRNGVLSFQQLLADCNPQQPNHWLKQRCDAGKTHMLTSTHEDNPRYFHADRTMTSEGESYMAKLDDLTGVRYLRLRKGIWAAAEGVIYEGWQDATHLVPRFEPPRDWTRLWAVDFGFIHPFVWQEWVADPDGRLYLYREIYRTKRLVEDHARQIKELTKNTPRPRAIVCDHDAEDRATLERHLGMGTIPANKNVSEGIQAVAGRLKVNETGKPRLMIMKDACVERDHAQADARKPTCTAEEIGGYIWLDGRLKEQPLKENDDGCDAMRYVTAEQDLRGITRVRWA
jgi:phage terminase large subunit